ncbi:hypothetical protein B0T10DRAFT_471832 [Thelonectria olida]|uniref:Uncharacterized protein n=1 Tax=Thelonectria olida TaxID=1576542 RepID=A0A9P8WFZ3_9HYPO|nr:hypothetical protein B0T10DRAFT_471832 [Thelonectria olida]
MKPLYTLSFLMLALLVVTASPTSLPKLNETKVGVPLQFSDNKSALTPVFGKGTSNTTDDEEIPQRVDVRCRYQKVRWRPGDNNYIIYKIFMAPHDQVFPHWCDTMEGLIRSQCRHMKGESLLPPDAIRWRRCDLDSTDEVGGGRGYTASFELRQWDENRFDQDNDLYNVKCMLNAIQWAANGSFVDWFYKDKCYQIKRLKYRLSY